MGAVSALTMATIYYTASSLDGFIADPEQTLSWLLTRDVDGRGPMGYEAFMDGVGALAMGSHTYEWLLADASVREEGWPYAIPCWVFTHRPLVTVSDQVALTADPVPAIHDRLRTAAAGRHVWIVGGGDLAGQFADAGLLDEVWVQYAPVTLGSGLPLLPRRLDLELLEVARNRDFACVRYRLAVL